MIVSMNMWGFMPEFGDRLKSGFEKFFQTAVKKNPLKAEYLLPDVIGTLLKERLCSVKVLPTESKWFGMTYKNDKNGVAEHLRELINDGVYRLDLYSDLTR